jgi:hypothetical protein
MDQRTKPVQVLIPPSEVYNDKTTILNDRKSKLDEVDNDHTPGRRARDVYDTTLSWWRAGVRRKLVTTVHWESQIIANVQVSFH